MRIRLKAKIFYITVLILLTGTTLLALYDGGYHIDGGAIAGIVFASILTSLLPFYISMNLFNKYELSHNEMTHLKAWGLTIYLFCFPVKNWIIYWNLILLLNGGGGWSFG